MNIKKQFIDQQVKEFSKHDSEELKFINKDRIIMDMILSNTNPADRVLDIGCYDGKILKELEFLGYTKLYGVDIQQKSKLSFNKTKINYAMCDIENEPIPFKHNFDLIIITDVLEHLFSPQTVLYDLRSRLNKNGKIVFSMPNAGWFLNGFLLTFLPSKLFISTAFGPWGHTHQFTFFEVKKICKKVKYSILELRGGRLDNYSFRSGVRKIVVDMFNFLTIPLVNILPTIFSAHIFGTIQITNSKPSKLDRIDLGN